MGAQAPLDWGSGCLARCRLGQVEVMLGRRLVSSGLRASESWDRSAANRPRWPSGERRLSPQRSCGRNPRQTRSGWGPFAVCHRRPSSDGLLALLSWPASQAAASSTLSPPKAARLRAVDRLAAGLDRVAQSGDAEYARCHRQTIGRCRPRCRWVQAHGAFEPGVLLLW